MKKSFLGLFLVFCIGYSAEAQTVVTVSAPVTANTTWTSNNIYLLTGGFIYVENNATLTIQPGTLIKGNASALVVTRGAKLVADGTPTQPIVFTSYQPTGFRQAGDWGGILLLGKATINDPAGERLAEGGIDPVKGLYGGAGSPDDNDSSGVLRYVRIEYAGIAFQPNNETNSLTMGGVGRKTVIDYVQVSYGGDDGFEWFGGTVNAKHLIVNKTLDDMFDSDYGWTGKVQFAVGISDTLIADISTSNSFESDNDATGTLNAPNTKPIFSNVTIVGPRITSATTYNSLFGRALHLRRSTSTCTYNSVFTGFKVGLKIESANSAAHVTSGSLQFKNNVIAGCGVSPYTTNPVLDSSGLSFGMLNWFNTNANSILPNSTDIQLGGPYAYYSPNLVPQATSPLLTGADFTSANLVDPFFTPTTYRGAIGTTDWTKCWSSFNPQANVYGTVPINNAVATPTVTAGGSTTICQGNSVTLSAPSSASYAWSNGAMTQSIAASAAGNYSVTVFNVYGCSASSAPVAVTVNALPTASVTASGSTTICQGGSVTLTANSSSSYQWSTGASTQSITASVAGNYNVTVTDANGCSNTSANTALVVNALPTATITASGPTVFCTGDSVALSANASSAYSWSTGATTQTIVVTASGTYYAMITDANGCTSASSNQISVSVSSAPPPTITVTGSTTLCQGGVTTLCASTSDTYMWSTGATTQCITANTAGSYTVTVTNTDACDGTGASAPTTVTVNPLPTAGFTFNASSQPSVSFTNGSTGAASYVWDFGDGSFSTLANPVHIYASNGTYTVCVTATSAAGCTATNCQVVTLNVGVNEIENITYINLYPNPANNQATLEFTLEDNSDIKIIISDLAGKEVFRIGDAYPAGKHSIRIDLSEMKNGIYLTRIINGNTNKIIKTVVLK